MTETINLVARHGVRRVWVGKVRSPAHGQKMIEQAASRTFGWGRWYWKPTHNLYGGYAVCANGYSAGDIVGVFTDSELAEFEAFN